ncbi:hypothetical protein BNJ_00027 [Kaumoebavirus]|uniref:hypothetical protein n=1 Tax=Kaumoebavirus TaxID=1859492 RepID=UPI0009C1E278|nr:hypothetical protein BNJ_00027 [Kaumoebavirus]ARA71870.1 hypothetical protein BNJ_00027 [Kaumoebavirus]
MEPLLYTDPFKVDIWPEVCWDWLYVSKEWDALARKTIKRIVMDEPTQNRHWPIFWASIRGFDGLVARIMGHDKFCVGEDIVYIRLGYQYAMSVGNQRIIELYRTRTTKHLFGNGNVLFQKSVFSEWNDVMRKEITYEHQLGACGEVKFCETNYSLADWIRQN